MVKKLTIIYFFCQKFNQNQKVLKNKKGHPTYRMAFLRSLFNLLVVSYSFYKNFYHLRVDIRIDAMSQIGNMP